MQKRNLIILAGVVFVAGAWYAFRPERLFVNQTVNESLTSVTSAESKGAVETFLHARSR